MTEDECQVKVDRLSSLIKKAGGWINPGCHTDLKGFGLLYGKSDRTIRDMRQRGDFPPVLMMGRPMIDLYDLVVWLEEKTER